MKAIIKNVTVNTADIESSVRFWSKFLKVEIKDDYGGYVFLESTDENSITLSLQLVEDMPKHETFVHIDILVDDKKAATNKIIELGGSLIREQGVNNIVADPAGNRFCIYDDE